MHDLLNRYRGGLPFSPQERDIDLLLLELMHTAPDVVAWFMARLGLEGAGIASGHHSVYRTHGETDVLLVVRRGEERIAVLIEDKIGAPMQPDQCGRYHLRGQALCDDGSVARYLTVLLAPGGYLRGVPEAERWHHRIAFEELAAALGTAPEGASAWKAAVLMAAGGRQQRAREADNKANKAYDAGIALLKRAYRDHVLACFPVLKASPQEGRDREYYIGAAGLPAGIRFKHAFFKGEASLIFERAWVDKARQALAATLPEGVWAVLHGSEYHLRTAVEVMDPQVPFAEQKDIADAALTQIMALLPLARRVAGA